ncbi:helix-turn-helix domain-containing protein [Rhodococcus opacus]|uniref:PucR family transcriptional regulator n=1 Tax=Rhodococcus opacus TaxID=37919 RepID=UPI001FF26228|nr:helix-turn-helix domain-containing protein [Rhodococcus opacus]UOT01448.1 helix-turn-helix domain-containing protein [Rhodococcus opacus]
MEPGWVGARDERERRLWSTVLQPAAVELAARAAELSDAVVAYTSGRLPDLLANAEAFEANRASTEASIRDFAEVLQSGADPTAAASLGSATLAYAQDGARHGIPLTTLLRSYRLGHAATSRLLNTILANHVSDADDLNMATELCSAWMFAYVDTALLLVEDVYSTERDRWLRSTAATQADTVATILSGQPVDIDVAGRRLRHELGRVHVGAIAWLDTHEEGRDTLTLLEAAIRDIAAALGSKRPLIHPLGILSVAAWISSTADVPSRALDELRLRTATAPGVRVAIGEPARGIAGFRASHVEALHAQRVAQLDGSPAGSVTRYHDISLRALATTDLDHARAFVERELGRLASGDETTRRLAATVRVYLSENGSRGRTAKRLSIHENTVSYRLRQAEEILGRSVDKRTLELRVALALADLVGEASDTNRSAPDVD